MDFKKKSVPFVNIGSSSLLVVFLILCLVTFATLSLSSAQSNYNFSQRLAERRTAYYNASNRASEILDSIDTVLERTYRDSSGSYYTSAMEQIEALTFTDKNKDTVLTLDFSVENPTISYTVPINEKQALSVIIELASIGNTEEGFYRMKQWKTISNSQWSGDNTLKLIER